MKLVFKVRDSKEHLRKDMLEGTNQYQKPLSKTTMMQQSDLESLYPMVQEASANRLNRMGTTELSKFHLDGMPGSEEASDACSGDKKVIIATSEDDERREKEEINTDPVNSQIKDACEVAAV